MTLKTQPAYAHDGSNKSKKQRSFEALDAHPSLTHKYRVVLVMETLECTMVMANTYVGLWRKDRGLTKS